MHVGRARSEWKLYMSERVCAYDRVGLSNGIDLLHIWILWIKIPLILFQIKIQKIAAVFLWIKIRRIRIENICFVT